MPETYSHQIQYKIIFTKPVDYFDIVLQKQINLRQKFNINENGAIVVQLDIDKRFIKSEFIKKYMIFYDPYFFDFSFLQLNNHPDKYKFIKKLYEKAKITDITFNNSLLCQKSYEEFEHEIELMLEEFKLFLDKFEFNEDEQKIINSFILDDNLKSNIKFIGWIDFIH